MLFISQRYIKLLMTVLLAFLDEVKQMIRSAEPEIVADIMQYGIYLTGGTAQLSGLAERIGAS